MNVFSAGFAQRRVRLGQLGLRLAVLEFVVVVLEEVQLAVLLEQQAHRRAQLEVADFLAFLDPLAGIDSRDAAGHLRHRNVAKLSNLRIKTDFTIL